MSLVIYSCTQIVSVTSDALRVMDMHVFDLAICSVIKSLDEIIQAAGNLDVRGQVWDD